MEFHSQQAIWQQIAQQIATRILEGEWAEEERIPSVRGLAAELQVNPNTIVRTYGFLQDEGIIENQRGLGYFVAKKGIKQAKVLKKRTFIEEVLPRFFQMMDELEMDFEEVKKLYHGGRQDGHFV